MAKNWSRKIENGVSKTRRSYIEPKSGEQTGGQAPACGRFGPVRRGSPRSKEVEQRVASALPLQASSCIDPHNSGGWRAAELAGRIEEGWRRLAGLSPTSTAEKRMRREVVGTERWKKGRSNKTE